MDRTTAFEFLKEHVKSDSLIKHCLAVEAAMIGYAKLKEQDIERWSLCGLLHDIDFEEHPDKHPMVGLDWLREKGFDEEFVMAVRSHAVRDNLEGESLMGKTLYAVDEMASFIIAVALVRPDGLEGLTAKSVKKKLKDKAFARAVNRDIVADGATTLGLELDQHIDIVIEALYNRNRELKSMSLSLL